MDKNDKIDQLAQTLANLATDYAEDNGLDFGDVMNALGRTYVTYGFTVKTDKITNEALSESLVGFVDAACKLMMEALRHAEKA
jgi:hypothetical protein